MDAGDRRDHLHRSLADLLQRGTRAVLALSEGAGLSQHRQLLLVPHPDPRLLRLLHRAHDRQAASTRCSPASSTSRAAARSARGGAMRATLTAPGFSIAQLQSLDFARMDLSGSTPRSSRRVPTSRRSRPTTGPGCRAATSAREVLIAKLNRRTAHRRRCVGGHRPVVRRRPRAGHRRPRADDRRARLADGDRAGSLTSKDAESITKHFKATGPILIDVSTVKRYARRDAPVSSCPSPRTAYSCPARPRPGATPSTSASTTAATASRQVTHVRSRPCPRPVARRACSPSWPPPASAVTRPGRRRGSGRTTQVPATSRALFWDDFRRGWHF